MYLVLQALLVVCVYLSVWTSRPGPAEESQSAVVKFDQKDSLLHFVLYASVVLVHQSCSSFIVLNKKNKTFIVFHLSWVIYDHVK